MTPDVGVLKNKKACDMAPITAADNQKMQVKSYGEATIEPNGKPIEIKNVLHVPELAVNLLSVSRIAENGNVVIFDKKGCTIKNEKDEVLAYCKQANGVYRLETKRMCMLAKSTNTAMEWHRRLGHVNFQTLKRMKSNPMYGIKFDDDGNEVQNCVVCAKGKHTRNSFTKSETTTKQVLELVHSDLAGPMENISYGGAKYMLVFVDDFSRMVFLYFLKQKSEVLEKFIDFKNMMENQMNAKIKIFRTDNGGEYVGKEFEKFCRLSGIEHQLTAPHTPQQNGVAERMNRTVIEKARCLVFDANLNKRVWAEACNMAAYIRNRTPSSSIGYKAPIEMWTGEGVNLEMLKLFGSDVMVHIPAAQRKKWSAKSTKMTFVGYDTRSKAYRCLNPETWKVIVSRDVIFLNNVSSKFQVEIGDSECQSNADSEQNSQSESGAVGDTEQEENDSSVREEMASSIEQDSDEIVSSPSNEIDLNDTVVTLGNNTANNDDFEDALGDNTELDETTTDNTDETFKTRARIDEPTTPRASTRDRRAFVPFQIGHFAFFNTEPSDAKEALESDENVHWKKAMDEEMGSHRKNETWELVQLPQNCTAIAGKWVFKRKMNNNGEVIRYKARFVAKGFAQRYGRDYYETFSPVVRHTTIRFLLAMAVKNGMQIFQMDAETAFLQGDLHENVYMRQAQNYDDKTGRVYRLKKAIYGLKQASRMWNIKLNETLLKDGFTRCKTDPCVYYKKGIVLAVYVDDFLILYRKDDELAKLRQMLHAHFNMKDIGLASSCLGINIKQGSDFIEIDQSHYVKQILKRFGMEKCKSAPTPSDLNQKLSITMFNEENSLVGKVPYQEIIGSLLYLSGATRPDIAFAVNDLSRFNNNHSEPHWKALKRILRYLRGSINLKIRYERTANNKIIAFSDADWGADIDKRRSCTGYVIKMTGGAVSWCSQRQPIVALSSTESEYIALSTAVREILWIKQLSRECDEYAQNGVEIFCDNQSAINIGEVEAYRQRSKHIDIRFHHIREQIEKGVIALKYIETEKMVADLLTKAVPRQKTEFCRIGMGAQC